MNFEDPLSFESGTLNLTTLQLRWMFLIIFNPFTAKDVDLCVTKKFGTTPEICMAHFSRAHFL